MTTKLRDTFVYLGFLGLITLTITTIITILLTPILIAALYHFGTLSFETAVIVLLVLVAYYGTLI